MLALPASAAGGYHTVHAELRGAAATVLARSDELLFTTAQDELRASGDSGDSGGSGGSGGGSDGSSSSSSSISSSSSDGSRGRAAYFDAFTDGPVAHPMARRPFALLGGELMFRSTGTSNPGRNFPGLWLPSAGVCPVWFSSLGSPVNSFRDLNRRAIDAGSGTVMHEDAAAASEQRRQLRAAALRVFPMIDKRFSVARDHDRCRRAAFQPAERCAAPRAWAALEAELRGAWERGGLVDAQMAARAGSAGGTVLLERFYSLRALVASVRLGAAAWHANGHWRAALAVLRVAAAAGLPSAPAPPAKGSAPAIMGMCSVNEHVNSQLGFHIDGWPEFHAAACSTVEAAPAAAE